MICNKYYSNNSKRCICLGLFLEADSYTFWVFVFTAAEWCIYGNNSVINSAHVNFNEGTRHSVQKCVSLMCFKQFLDKKQIFDKRKKLNRFWFHRKLRFFSNETNTNHYVLSDVFLFVLLLQKKFTITFLGL